MTRSASDGSHARATTAVANVLTIAGVDPSGGAGLLADVKTFTALGAFGCGVVTALTVQNTRRVAEVTTVAPALVRAQLTHLFADVPIAAAKTGMMGNEAVVDAVVETLAEAMATRPLPLVVDPVMVATSGDPLLSAEAISRVRQRLLPLATVITPNLPEAAVLTDRPLPRNVAEMRAMAAALRDLLPPQPGRWVFLKGGHLPEEAPLVDVAFDGHTYLTFSALRRHWGALHGTGCTLAAAITALLGQWANRATADTFLTASVAEPLFAAAHRYLQGAVAAAKQLAAGTGAKPLYHAFGRSQGRAQQLDEV